MLKEVEQNREHKNRKIDIKKQKPDEKKTEIKINQSE